MSETQEAPGEQSQEQTQSQETKPVAVETETERKRRRLRPNEVHMLKRYLAFADPGIAIAFNDLPDIDMKRALFPSSQLRLVEKELLSPVYNEETGLLESVTINEDMLQAYQWDLKAPEPRVTVRQRDPDEPRQRRPRGLLNNDKYRIFKLKDENPRREATHAWYNWEHCYLNDLTIPEYLSRLDYPRDIVVKGKFGDSWFNGPETLYLYQDFKAGNLGIYDSTKDKQDSEYWLKSSAIEPEDMESADTNNETEESQSSAEPEPTPAG